MREISLVLGSAEKIAELLGERDGLGFSCNTVCRLKTIGLDEAGRALFEAAARPAG